MYHTDLEKKHKKTNLFKKRKIMQYDLVARKGKNTMVVWTMFAMQFYEAF